MWWPVGLCYHSNLSNYVIISRNSISNIWSLNFSLEQILTHGHCFRYSSESLQVFTLFTFCFLYLFRVYLYLLKSAVHFWLQSAETGCDLFFFLLESISTFNPSLVVYEHPKITLFIKFQPNRRKNKEVWIFYPDSQEPKIQDDIIKYLLLLDKIFDAVWHCQISWLLAFKLGSCKAGGICHPPSPLSLQCQSLKSLACLGLNSHNSLQ